MSNLSFVFPPWIEEGGGRSGGTNTNCGGGRRKVLFGNVFGWAELFFLNKLLVNLREILVGERVGVVVQTPIVGVVEKRFCLEMCLVGLSCSF